MNKIIVLLSLISLLAFISTTLYLTAASKQNDKAKLIAAINKTGSLFKMMALFAPLCSLQLRQADALNCM
ncbi:hypothetical protein [Candidatus Pantoea deserta]|uniref:hypothetical protein n=1 Tax=Candidatus Pantoea deserta TaxID=1869313 RepID=UPI000F4E3A6B|nr:hypothetical protein [Pantoea deserta]